MPLNGLQHDSLLLYFVFKKACFSVLELMGSAVLNVEDSDDYELEEGEWIPEEDYAPIDSGETIFHEGPHFTLTFISFFQLTRTLNEFISHLEVLLKLRDAAFSADLVIITHERCQN